MGAMEIDKDDICARIAQQWKRFPSMRLGQLIANAISARGGYGGRCDCDPFYVEDKQLVGILEDYELDIDE